MIYLLKIEWLKLKKYTAFIVVGIFFIVGVFATNYIVYTVNKNIIQNVGAAGLISFSPYNFANTWQSTSYATGFILLLPALLMFAGQPAVAAEPESRPENRFGNRPNSTTE